MSHLKSAHGEQWYDVDVVVELLIHEMPRGERYAPEIGNLCVGFSRLSPEKLLQELTDMRAHWPFLFPKDFTTTEILRLIQKKYPAYQEIVTLQQIK